MTDVLTWMQQNQDWIWLAIGVALLIGEILVPGVFLLWIGLAGVVTGFIVMIFTNLSFEVQGVLFSVLSIASILAGRNLMRSVPEASLEAPNLNKRGASMVGQKYILATAIKQGEGRVHVGDTVWTAVGEDMPEGTRVVVTRVDGTTVHVQKAGD